MTTNNPVKTSDSEAPSPSFLQQLEGKSAEAVGNFLKMPSKPKTRPHATLTAEQLESIRLIEERAIHEFTGDLTQLEAALGMLRMGHYCGWKVLYLIHSKKTIRNYEAILKVRVRDVFGETGPTSYRSIGLNIAERFSNFWKVAGGEIKIPHKQQTQ